MKRKTECDACGNILRVIYIGEHSEKWKKVISCPNCHIVYDLIPKSSKPSHNSLSKSFEDLKMEIIIDNEYREWLEEFRKLHYLATMGRAIEKLIDIHKAWNLDKSSKPSHNNDFKKDSLEEEARKLQEKSKEVIKEAKKLGY